MSQVNNNLALELARKTANEMELQHVRELVADNIYTKLLKLSREELIKQAAEAGILITNQLINDNAIELLQDLIHEIRRQTGSRGRCPDYTYYDWSNQIKRVISLLN